MFSNIKAVYDKEFLEGKYFTWDTWYMNKVMYQVLLFCALKNFQFSFTLRQTFLIDIFIISSKGDNDDAKYLH